MPAGGVPGFFGENKRNVRPVGLDLTFVYDISGSMNNVIGFVQSLSTVQRIEQALLDENVGITQPNRYSQSNMENENTISSSRWVTGEQVLAGNIDWANPQFTGIRVGNDIEDVTGSANALAAGNRDYRSGIQRIMISFSDEQGGATLGATNTVEATLTSPTTGQIFIAASGLTLTYTGTPSNAPTGGGWEPFGLVYTTPTQGVIIFRNTSTNAVQYSNIPIANTSWGSGFGLNDPIVASNSSSLIQRVNTPRLAAATGGAVYNIDDMLSTDALEAFGISIGQVLGRLLYELLS